MGDIRVRFAPSPTGSLHIGGARTALFNWFFARHHNGTFVLRIEDTDLDRSTDESARGIVSALRWLGLDWDEGPEIGGDFGPYFQSQRLAFYQEAVNRLLEQGQAYYCYCTQEELSERRQEAMKSGRAPRYDGRCRHLTKEERARLEQDGRHPALRFHIPPSGETVVSDVIRGEVAFSHDVLDDFIIMKSNGLPAYNFACVVDDSSMRISHVLRAEEHLSNTPRQILIYQALGKPLPVFVHLPMILAPDRSKLSKRHGATSVQEFQEQGFLPEALLNYLALLGWSPDGEEEIMPLTEMVRQFSLDRVGKTAAIYDTKKLTWMNGHYLNETILDSVVEQALPFLWQKGLVPQEISPSQQEYIKRVVELVRTRVKTLAEVAEAADYFFSDDFTYEEKGLRKHFSKPGVDVLLGAARHRIERLELYEPQVIEEAYRDLSAELGVGAGEIIHPTRLALSGRTMGPGLFELMAVLGKTKSLQRLSQAVQYIRQQA
ncbi:MAG: glutamate--tRNA ligase [Thermacetogeniaceae bacterium]